MTKRVIVPLALAAGFCLPAAGWAKSPTKQPAKGKPAPAATRAAPAAPAAGDVATAEAVATKIMEGVPLEGCKFDVGCSGGVVELAGTVLTPAHAAEIEKRAKAVPGVRGVSNKLTVTAGLPTPARSPIVPVAAQMAPPAALPPVPGPVAGPGPGPYGPPPGAYGPPPGAYGPPVTMGGPVGPNGEPVPVSGGGPAVADLNPPRMPSYAWPTYAPYNNYSRVAHPTLYPYNAWPFIGPFYPFPKVPLGWRKVTLEWQDGHWYYGKEAADHDYWRIRYW